MNNSPTEYSEDSRTQAPLSGAQLVRLFLRARERTEQLALPLSPEDQGLQSMPAASPTKWHRAHTTWFFETFLLSPSGIAPVDPQYRMLFNSYYEGIGPRPVRAWRGLLSRPAVEEVAAYRRAVDARMSDLLLHADESALRRLEPLVLLGIAHEEQHQELILTDILHAFSHSPLLPAYRPPERATSAGSRSALPLSFLAFGGGQVSLGARPTDRFFFDNEQPRHERWVEPFSLANRLVTVGELKSFIADGGYRTPSLWLSDGWDYVRSHDLQAPLYSRVEGETYVLFGLTGERAVSDDEPAVHLSFYEADALATWLSARLPTEAEWETAAAGAAIEGTFLDSGALKALPASAGPGLLQLFGDAWEWTRSSYEPYPRYRPAAGAIGEYNGKFMVNQIVLRGGSCFTPPGHVRPSYRNFWPPDTRHQMTGLRLARDL